MSQRTLLLFVHDGEELGIIGRALRDAGYVVFPARFHEEGADALVRVRPQLVLVDAANHRTVITPDLRKRVAELGVRVFLFARSEGPDDAAALQELRELPYPLLDYSGDARALAALVEEVQGAGSGDEHPRG